MSATLTPFDTKEDAFARDLGFVEFDDLIRISEPVATDDGELWFLTGISDHCWVTWTCPIPHRDSPHRFDSYQEARDFVSHHCHTVPDSHLSWLTPWKWAPPSM
ncbi:MAG TPA: hypothetical protein VM165_16875 [Planctomycetaceae bacterium]|nr:hypothetical protein [Planctomycetaceae bacterium]